MAIEWGTARIRFRMVAVIFIAWAVLATIVFASQPGSAESAVRLAAERAELLTASRAQDSIASLPSMDLRRATADTMWFPHVTPGATTLSIQSASSLRTSFTLTMHDGAGTVIDEATHTNVVLEPYEARRFSVTDESVRWAQVTSTGHVIGTALVENSNVTRLDLVGPGEDPNIKVGPVAYNAWRDPQNAEGRTIMPIVFRSGSGARTHIKLLNTSSESQSADIRFYEEGSDDPTEQTVTLAPGEARFHFVPVATGEQPHLVSVHVVGEQVAAVAVTEGSEGGVAYTGAYSSVDVVTAPLQYFPYADSHPPRYADSILLRNPDNAGPFGGLHLQLRPIGSPENRWCNLTQATLDPLDWVHGRACVQEVPFNGSGHIEYSSEPNVDTLGTSYGYGEYLGLKPSEPEGSSGTRDFGPQILIPQLLPASTIHITSLVPSQNQATVSCVDTKTGISLRDAPGDAGNTTPTISDKNKVVFHHHGRSTATLGVLCSVNGGVGSIGGVVHHEVGGRAGDTRALYPAQTFRKRADFPAIGELIAGLTDAREAYNDARNRLALHLSSFGAATDAAAFEREFWNHPIDPDNPGGSTYSVYIDNYRAATEALLNFVSATSERALTEGATLPYFYLASLVQLIDSPAAWEAAPALRILSARHPEVLRDHDHVDAAYRVSDDYLNNELARVLGYIASEGTDRSVPELVTVDQIDEMLTFFAVRDPDFFEAASTETTPGLLAEWAPGQNASPGEDVSTIARTVRRQRVTESATGGQIDRARTAGLVTSVELSQHVELDIVGWSAFTVKHVTSALADSTIDQRGFGLGLQILFDVSAVTAGTVSVAENIASRYESPGMLVRALERASMTANLLGAVEPLSKLAAAIGGPAVQRAVASSWGSYIVSLSSTLAKAGPVVGLTLNVIVTWSDIQEDRPNSLIAADLLAVAGAGLILFTFVGGWVILTVGVVALVVAATLRSIIDDRNTVQIELRNEARAILEVTELESRLVCGLLAVDYFSELFDDDAMRGASLSVLEDPAQMIDGVEFGDVRSARFPQHNIRSLLLHTCEIVDGAVDGRTYSPIASSPSTASALAMASQFHCLRSSDDCDGTKISTAIAAAAGQDKSQLFDDLREIGKAFDRATHEADLTFDQFYPLMCSALLTFWGNPTSHLELFQLLTTSGGDDACNYSLCSGGGVVAATAAAQAAVSCPGPPTFNPMFTTAPFLRYKVNPGLPYGAGAVWLVLRDSGGGEQARSKASDFTPEANCGLSCGASTEDLFTGFNPWERLNQGWKICLQFVPVEGVQLEDPEVCAELSGTATTPTPTLTPTPTPTPGPQHFPDFNVLRGTTLVVQFQGSPPAVEYGRPIVANGDTQVTIENPVAVSFIDHPGPTPTGWSEEAFQLAKPETCLDCFDYATQLFDGFVCVREVPDGTPVCFEDGRVESDDGVITGVFHRVRTPTNFPVAEEPPPEPVESILLPLVWNASATFLPDSGGETGTVRITWPAVSFIDMVFAYQNGDYVDHSQNLGGEILIPVNRSAQTRGECWRLHSAVGEIGEFSQSIDWVPTCVDVPARPVPATATATATAIPTLTATATPSATASPSATARPLATAAPAPPWFNVRFRESNAQTETGRLEFDWDASALPSDGWVVVSRSRVPAGEGTGPFYAHPSDGEYTSQQYVWPTVNGSCWEMWLQVRGVESDRLSQCLNADFHFIPAPVPTPTSTPTSTPTATPTSTPTATPTSTPTATPTSTPTSTPTPTPLPAPTGFTVSDAFVPGQGDYRTAVLLAWDEANASVSHRIHVAQVARPGLPAAKNDYPTYYGATSLIFEPDLIQVDDCWDAWFEASGQQGETARACISEITYPPTEPSVPGFEAIWYPVAGAAGGGVMDFTWATDGEELSPRVQISTVDTTGIGYSDFSDGRQIREMSFAAAARCWRIVWLSDPHVETEPVCIETSSERPVENALQSPSDFAADFDYTPDGLGGELTFTWAPDTGRSHVEIVNGDNYWKVDDHLGEFSVSSSPADATDCHRIRAVADYDIGPWSRCLNFEPPAPQVDGLVAEWFQDPIQPTMGTVRLRWSSALSAVSDNITIIPPNNLTFMTRGINEGETIRRLVFEDAEGCWEVRLAQWPDDEGSSVCITTPSAVPVDDAIAVPTGFRYDWSLNVDVASFTNLDSTLSFDWNPPAAISHVEVAAWAAPPELMAADAAWTRDGHAYDLAGCYRIRSVTSLAYSPWSSCVTVPSGLMPTVATMTFDWDGRSPAGELELTWPDDVFADGHLEVRRDSGTTWRWAVSQIEAVVEMPFNDAAGCYQFRRVDGNLRGPWSICADFEPPAPQLTGVTATWFEDPLNPASGWLALGWDNTLSITSDEVLIQLAAGDELRRDTADGSAVIAQSWSDAEGCHEVRLARWSSDPGAEVCVETPSERPTSSIAAPTSLPSPFLYTSSTQGDVRLRWTHRVERTHVEIRKDGGPVTWRAASDAGQFEIPAPVDDAAGCYQLRSVTATFAVGPWGSCIDVEVGAAEANGQVTENLTQPRSEGTVSLTWAWTSTPGASGFAPDEFRVEEVANNTGPWKVVEGGVTGSRFVRYIGTQSSYVDTVNLPASEQGREICFAAVPYLNDQPVANNTITGVECALSVVSNFTATWTPYPDGRGQLKFEWTEMPEADWIGFINAQTGDRRHAPSTQWGNRRMTVTPEEAEGCWFAVTLRSITVDGQEVPDFETPSLPSPVACIDLGLDHELPANHLFDFEGVSLGWVDVGGTEISREMVQRDGEIHSFLRVETVPGGTLRRIVTESDRLAITDWSVMDQLQFRFFGAENEQEYNVGILDANDVTYWAKFQDMNEAWTDVDIDLSSFVSAHGDSFAGDAAVTSLRIHWIGPAGRTFQLDDFQLVPKTDDELRVMAAAEIRDALDAWALYNGTHLVTGSGWNRGGQGWFNYTGGRYYTSIADGLVEAGYLTAGDVPHDPQQPDTNAHSSHDFMIYRCQDRVGIFAKTDELTTPPSAIDWWNANGCIRTPIDTYDHGYLTLSDPIPEDGYRAAEARRVLAALEAYGDEWASYWVLGSGRSESGQGWFRAETGNYGRSVANALAAEGLLLADDLPHDPAHLDPTRHSAADFMVYRCGDRVGVFARTSVLQTDQDDLSWWTSNGCLQVPLTTYDHTWLLLSKPLQCDGQNVTVNLAIGQRPTTGDDVILGTHRRDVINASHGDDVICGSHGDDVIFANQGDDIIHGGSGNDRLFGGHGNDVVHGGVGDDIVVNNLGLDVLHGGPGADLMTGGPNADQIRGDDGDDVLRGRSGDDIIYGGFGNDIISGAGGNDFLAGNQNDDVLYGGSGDDQLHGGYDDDKVYGQSGNDTLVNNRGTDTMNGGTGTDSCHAATDLDLLVGC